ncbi:hypothetical protein PoB_007453400 [Plakobranchus ocellatus]|uniref:Uncharacterized protein n=1 Tax=Plakobranchus ocellatus TaxID=259542 RepID=A0AAV4DVJ0_9GAST|nr:hypothetical protein PoB_007453400 [Plakobranchus ocellatus]
MHSECDDIQNSNYIYVNTRENKVNRTHHPTTAVLVLESVSTSLPLMSPGQHAKETTAVELQVSLPGQTESQNSRAIGWTRPGEFGQGLLSDPPVHRILKGEKGTRVFLMENMSHKYAR